MSIKPMTRPLSDAHPIPRGVGAWVRDLLGALAFAGLMVEMIVIFWVLGA